MLWRMQDLVCSIFCISCNSHFIFGAQMTTVTLGGYNFVVDHLSLCICCQICWQVLNHKPLRYLQPENVKHKTNIQNLPFLSIIFSAILCTFFLNRCCTAWKYKTQERTCESVAVMQDASAQCVNLVLGFKGVALVMQHLGLGRGSQNVPKCVNF